jgi:hypothetical protein
VIILTYQWILTHGVNEANNTPIAICLWASSSRLAAVAGQTIVILDCGRLISIDF